MIRWPWTVQRSLLLETNAHAATIFRNELYAGIFQHALDAFQGGRPELISTLKSGDRLR